MTLGLHNGMAGDGTVLCVIVCDWDPLIPEKNRKGRGQNEKIRENARKRQLLDFRTIYVTEYYQDHA